ncbi:YagK/YfjJ domain-containing protein [Vibrio cyclitrophicus]|uniref:YagK/YfjJ domain-containing protein n=1 Tax=Vibrio cyclitrophicus TaxID=47951 RepID=UPI0002D2625E|nr:inovirus-type Gp2 protein [Vibrio cyclitrophicus]OEF27344.1 hypothetical protein OA9_14360 [Vibrio cyclitrophicus 1F97]
MRLKLINKNTKNVYKHHSINPNYDLSESKLDMLIKTKNTALEEFTTTTAVRLDFGLPTKLQANPEDLYLLLSGDIQSAFNKFTNRLRRKKDSQGSTYQFLMNWKLEQSKSKGLHIHTVWYFDTAQIPTFNLKTKIYKLIKSLWLEQTNNHGLLKIITSSTAKSQSSFSVQGSDTQYFTLLTTDGDFLISLSEYHKQKNLNGMTSGWFRWISYLGKDGDNLTNSNQVAIQCKKRMGTVTNLFSKPLP